MFNDKRIILRHMKEMQERNHTRIGYWGTAPYILTPGHLYIGTGRLRGSIAKLGVHPQSLKTIAFNDRVRVPQDASGLFSHCSRLVHIYGMHRLDTSQTTDMSYMFYGTKRLISLSLASLDTHIVTNMQGMFARTGLSQIDISNWNVGKVQDMSYMFCDNPYLKKVVLAKDTHRVRDYAYFMALDPVLHHVQMNDLATDHAQSMKAMFADDAQLTEINLRSFKMKNVQDFQKMFQDCTRLVRIRGAEELPLDRMQTFQIPNHYNRKPRILITIPVKK